jgi:hypothetical protein
VVEGGHVAVGVEGAQDRFGELTELGDLLGCQDVDAVLSDRGDVARCGFALV